MAAVARRMIFPRIKHVIGAICAVSMATACGMGVDASFDAASGMPGASAQGTAASGDAPASAPEGAAAARGRLTVNLVDAPTEEVTGIIVTLSSLQADLADGSTLELMSGSVTVDLLTLQNGNFLGLGSVAVPAGDVARLRLIVDETGQNHVTLANGSTAPLKVPSGAESGIKLDGPFTVPGCGNTTVTVDFDGKKSLNVHATGKTGQYILRPVVFVKQVDQDQIPCEAEQTSTQDPDAGMAEEVDAGVPEAATDAGAAPWSATDAGAASWSATDAGAASPQTATDDAGNAGPGRADAGIN